MRAILQAAVLGCLSAAVSSGQRPTFDVASVKTVSLASHPVFGNRGGPGTSDPSRIHYCCVGMFSLLMRAYDVEIDQVIGPSWIMENMGPNLYQIDATMPAGTTKAQFQLMMQSLLADRFHLEIHRETRSFPGYELVVAKGGPRLKVSAKQPDGSPNLPPGPQMLTTLGRGHDSGSGAGETHWRSGKGNGETDRSITGRGHERFRFQEAARYRQDRPDRQIRFHHRVLL